MTDLNIRILMRLTARPGQETELRSLLLQFVANRCDQTGCRSCGMLQHRADATSFILIEEWDAEARLQSDLNTETFKGLFEAGAELMIEPPLIDWYNTIYPEENPI